jgi:hypothetical protein
VRRLKALQLFQLFQETCVWTCAMLTHKDEVASRSTLRRECPCGHGARARVCEHLLAHGCVVLMKLASDTEGMLCCVCLPLTRSFPTRPPPLFACAGVTFHRERGPRPLKYSRQRAQRGAGCVYNALDMGPEALKSFKKPRKSCWKFEEWVNPCQIDGG